MDMEAKLKEGEAPQLFSDVRLSVKASCSLSDRR